MSFSCENFAPVLFNGGEGSKEKPTPSPFPRVCPIPFSFFFHLFLFSSLIHSHFCLVLTTPRGVSRVHAGTCSCFSTPFLLTSGLAFRRRVQTGSDSALPPPDDDEEDDEEEMELDPEAFLQERHAQWRERQEVTQQRSNRKQQLHRKSRGADAPLAPPPQQQRHLLLEETRSAPSSPSR